MKQVDREPWEVNGHHANDVEVNPREVMEAKVQEIVKDINENRKHHADTMVNFRKELEKQARNEDEGNIIN